MESKLKEIKANSGEVFLYDQSTGTIQSKLKAAAMDSVGELPELGNLLLREGGFPHLPSPRFVPEKKADAWNDAGTKPDHPCLCQTIPYKEIKENDPDPIYQYWTGSFSLISL